MLASILHAGEEAVYSIEEISLNKTHHGADGRFFNPWCIDCGKSFTDLLKWRFSRSRYRELKKKEVTLNVAAPDFVELDKNPGDYMVWLGHSTVLMRVGGKTVLTDPVFGDVFFFIERESPPPIAPEGLPRIDYVLISHGHYDHLDTASLKFLKEHSDPYFITGPGYEDYFASIGTAGTAGATKHLVLDWFEEYRDGDLLIRSLPVHHWSKRGPFDTNRMLWCSYLVEGRGARYYWIGDTGYYGGFREIGEKFGPMDVVFVPVGGYEPRWFMKTYHVNPEEALMIARDVGARIMVPIHWGTFDLTDEPLWLPARKLRELHKAGPGLELRVLDQGGHIVLPPPGEVTLD